MAYQTYQNKEGVFVAEQIDKAGIIPSEVADANLTELDFTHQLPSGEVEYPGEVLDLDDVVLQDGMGGVE